MIWRTPSLSLEFLVSGCFLSEQEKTSYFQLSLEPTPKMIASGYYDAKTPPVLCLSHS